MNEEEKMSLDEYIESCKDALESLKAVLENPLLNKTAADFLKVIELTHDITKEVYYLSQENE